MSDSVGDCVPEWYFPMSDSVGDFVFLNDFFPCQIV
jgi:hypothetical protein